MKFDLANNLDVKVGIPPLSVGGNSVTSTAILDMRGANSAMLAILIGELADTDSTFAVNLEHGDESDLSDAVNVPDAEIIGTKALAAFQFDDDDSCRKIGYSGSKRYVRATITPSNNAGATFMGAVWLLGHLEDTPAPNPPV